MVGKELVNFITVRLISQIKSTKAGTVVVPLVHRTVLE